MCHNSSIDLVIDTDGLPLGHDHVAVQIAELLQEEDVPSKWMLSMKAWHIHKMFLNGDSLYNHDQRYIYNAAVHAFNCQPIKNIPQYDSKCQRQESPNPPKKVFKLST
jgi:hypothetical protein